MNLQNSRRIPSQRRGSILIVALLLAAIVAISIVSYLKLGVTAMSLAHRAFFENAAMNLAEGGLEQAMWSLDQTRTGSTTAWSDWTNDGTNAWKSFSDGNLGLSATGSVRVYVAHYKADLPPIITARATVQPATGSAVEKWVQVAVYKRSLFADGLVAKNTITFQGNNATVDSWVSDTDGDHNPLTGAQVPFSSGVKRDKGTAASTLITNAGVMVNNADIWGYVATGNSDPITNSDVVVGPNGSILGATSAAAGYGKIDPTRVSGDFTYNFQQITTPSTGVGISAISSTTTLTSGTYRVPSISLSGSKQLNIAPNSNVVIIVTASAGSSAISTTGNAGINVPAGSTLTIYAEGDIKIAGNGLLNGNNSPATVQIYGSIPSGGSAPATAQDVQIAGNGALSASVYAPNASIKVNGNGDVMGSIVGNDITMTGNAAFHYDESLANLGGGPFGISGWQELTKSSQRDGVAANLNF